MASVRAHGELRLAARPAAHHVDQGAARKPDIGGYAAFPRKVEPEPDILTSGVRPGVVIKISAWMLVPAACVDIGIGAPGHRWPL